MKKTIIFAASLLLGLIFICVMVIATIGSTYSMKMVDLSEISENNNQSDNVKVTFSNSGVVEYTGNEIKNNTVYVNFKAVKSGETDALIEIRDENGGAEQELPEAVKYSTHINVEGPFNTIFIRSDGVNLKFNGIQFVYLFEVLYFIILSVYLFIRFRRRVHNHLYSYKTIQCCNALLIALLLLGIFAVISLFAYLFNYSGTAMSGVFTKLNVNLMIVFTLCSVPFLLVFSVLMCLSNISLIRHEGFRPVNVLGIALSAEFIIAAVGSLVVWYCINTNADSSVEFSTAVSSIVSSMVVYAETVLLSAMICALISVKHKVAYNKDFIIILGCGIRKDGTLLPLLKGRVDRAIDFYNKQYAATGKKAVFVPSGGQGSDEIISEGEAMKRYLIEHGIPAQQIVPETKSTNTLENMKFSKAIIDEINPKSNVVFSTTNYHIFRSGMLAYDAGIKAEGIGSKTKWYFWPNAFVREFVGMLVKYWKQSLLLLLFLMAASGLSAVLTQIMLV